MASERCPTCSNATGRGDMNAIAERNREVKYTNGALVASGRAPAVLSGVGSTPTPTVIYTNTTKFTLLVTISCTCGTISERSRRWRAPTRCPPVELSQTRTASAVRSRPPLAIRSPMTRRSQARRRSLWCPVDDVGRGRTIKPARRYDYSHHDPDRCPLRCSDLCLDTCSSGRRSNARTIGIEARQVVLLANIRRPGTYRGS